MNNTNKIESFIIDDSITTRVCLDSRYRFLYVKDKTLFDKFVIGERIYIQETYYNISESLLHTVLGSHINKDNVLVVWLQR